MPEGALGASDGDEQTAAVGAGGERSVAVEAGAELMRDAAVDVHAEKPRAGAVGIFGEVEQGMTIEKNGIGDLCAEGSDAFGGVGRRLDAPDVQFIGEGAGAEVDE